MSSQSEKTLLVCLNEVEESSFFTRPPGGKLEGLFRNIIWQRPPQSSEELAQILRESGAEVLLASWSLPALPPCRSQIPDLEYVCYLAGSVRRKISKPLIHQGLLVSNWGGRIGRVVAECALALILMALREANFWTMEMHLHGRFKYRGYVGALSLFERRVGIHGFGSVARSLVKILQPFKCSLAAFSEGPPDEAFHSLGVTRAASLDELFSTCDIVVEAEAYNPATVGSVRESHLRLLGDGVFVNVGRAELVEENALYKVAREGRLRIGLDVYHEEPLPLDSPLRGLRNVALFPHLGGPTFDRRCDAGKLAIENLARFIKGESLEAVVTEEIYDRST